MFYNVCLLFMQFCSLLYFLEIIDSMGWNKIRLSPEMQSEDFKWITGKIVLIIGHDRRGSKA